MTQAEKILIRWLLILAGVANAGFAAAAGLDQVELSDGVVIAITVGNAITSGLIAALTTQAFTTAIGVREKPRG